MAELAGMERSCPIWRIVMLEFERFVEHTLYASNAYWTAVDFDAGVISEALTATVAAPCRRRHGGRVVV